MVLQVIASHHLNFFPMLFLWSPQDQRLVGVSSLCLHLSVRCDAHLVSYNLSNKAVLVNDSCWRKTVKTSFTELFLCSIVCVCVFFFQLCLCRPEGPMYQKFRSQFLAFSIYQSKDLTCLSGRLELDFKGTVWFEILKKKNSLPSLQPMLSVTFFLLLPLSQALSSSSSITTRVAACTGSELWEKEISWTSQWVRLQAF